MKEEVSDDTKRSSIGMFRGSFRSIARHSGTSLLYCRDRVALTCIPHKAQPATSSPPESETRRENSDDDLLEAEDSGLERPKDGSQRQDEGPLLEVYDNEAPDSTPVGVYHPVTDSDSLIFPLGTYSRRTWIGNT